MSTFSNPEINKKDQRNIEKTIGSVKELLTKQLEGNILYIEPGVNVVFSDSSLLSIYGSIIAVF